MKLKVNRGRIKIGLEEGSLGSGVRRDMPRSFGRRWDFPIMILGPGDGEFHEGDEVFGDADRLCSQRPFEKCSALFVLA